MTGKLHSNEFNFSLARFFYALGFSLEEFSSYLSMQRFLD